MSLTLQLMAATQAGIGELRLDVKPGQKLDDLRIVLASRPMADLPPSQE